MLSEGYLGIRLLGNFERLLIYILATDTNKALSVEPLFHMAT